MWKIFWYALFCIWILLSIEVIKAFKAPGWNECWKWKTSLLYCLFSISVIFVVCIVLWGKNIKTINLLYLHGCVQCLTIVWSALLCHLGHCHNKRTKFWKIYIGLYFLGIAFIHQSFTPGLIMLFTHSEQLYRALTS